MGCEIETKADFSGVRYAQCWEDADVLLEALDVRPGGSYLSIASAGDNVLALLSRDPARVVAVDLSPAQTACLELRVAAFRELAHPELLEFMGSVPSAGRLDLYDRCRGRIRPAVQQYWDGRRERLRNGLGAVGKLERFLEVVRRFLLPLVHPRSRIDRLLRPRTRSGRVAFYRAHWDNRRWRWLFRTALSPAIVGRCGRDPRFFDYAQGDLSEHLLRRAEHALTVLDPCENPYVQWLLLGGHRTALPHALRPENFQAVRRNLDRLEIRVQSLEDHLSDAAPHGIDGFNLSDIFEYMAPAACERLLERLAACGRTGGRLVYWNLLAPRRRPERLRDRLRPLDGLASDLHSRDKAFFYGALRVEEIQ
jgi:S-adenosylmethionine-diacylglycerol 3-amino-3-carboxypropyl transferase